MTIQRDNNFSPYSLFIGVACSVFLPALAEAASRSALNITASTLNVRTGAGANYTAVGYANSGEQYVLTGRAAGEWKEIWFDEAARWVYTTGYATNVTVECGTVTASSLNVRSGAGTGYRIVGSAPSGSKWSVLSSSGDWRKIWFDSEARWVHGGYLDQPSTPTPNIELRSFNINNNAASTSSRYVTAYSTTALSPATQYRISESSSFSGAAWANYGNSISFTLSSAGGNKTVYFQVRNADGRLSNVMSDTITYNAPSNPTPPPASGYRVDRSKFFDNFRARYGALSQSQVDGINYLLTNIEKDTRPAINNKTVWMRQIAYIFSTVKHEVANTYQPITEYSNTHCVRYDGGCTYKGRGYVQLTHRYNYSRMSPIVGVDLVANPTLALRPDIAYTVMSYGMHNGTFTGAKLGTYIKSGLTDYYNARRVVNGLDRATLLQGYARDFQTILERSTL